MDLKDCLIIFDDLNTQRKTRQVIKERKRHYIGGFKEKQLELLEDAKGSFMKETIKKCESKSEKAI